MFDLLIRVPLARRCWRRLMVQQPSRLNIGAAPKLC